jgi:hypothetical protein
LGSADERKVYRVKVGKPEERDDQSIDGRMGSEWILGRSARGCRVDTGWWRALVNTVMNLRVLTSQSYLIRRKWKDR